MIDAQKMRRVLLLSVNLTSFWYTHTLTLMKQKKIVDLKKQIKIQLVLWWVFENARRNLNETISNRNQICNHNITIIILVLVVKTSCG